MGLFRKKKRIDPKLLNHYAIQAKGCLEIYDDCQNLLRDTLNPAVFFMRYELAIQQLEMLNEIVTVTNNEIKYRGSNIPKQIKALKGMRSESYRDFILRYHNDSVYRASQLKTDKGKANNYIKSKEKLLNQSNYLTSKDIKFINEIWTV